MPGAVRLDSPPAAEAETFVVMAAGSGDPEASLSFRSVTYLPSGGRIVLPAAALAEAVSHGFVRVAETYKPIGVSVLSLIEIVPEPLAKEVNK